MSDRLYSPLSIFKDHPCSHWLNAQKSRPKEAAAIIERMKSNLLGDTSNMVDTQIAGAWAAETWIVKGAHKVSESHLVTISEAQLLQSAAIFDNDGHPIFAFGSALSEELCNTDLDDARVRDLNPPATCFYLTYEDAELLTPDGEPIDGFMIQKSVDTQNKTDDFVKDGEHVIEILIYPKRDRWSDKSSIPYVLVVPAGDENEPIMDAINRFLDYEVSMIQARKSRPAPGMTKLQLAEMTLMCLERVKKMRTCAEEIHRLVAGSLLYLTSYHDRGEERWPSGAPAKLVRRAMSNGENSDKASAELIAKGWVKLKYFNVERQGGESGSSDSNRATHWRRGHWRRQACGPGMSERRMRWIRPALINARPGAITATREYQVDQPTGGVLVPQEQSRPIILLPPNT